MTPYGFVDVRGDSERGLTRILELANRLSRSRPVMLRLEPGARNRIEGMLDRLTEDGWRDRIELLECEDPASAIQAAGFCVFSDNRLALHLRADQVAVYSPCWT